MCKMENIYYVYEHIRLDTQQVFYVGKGKGKRAWKRNSRNYHWSNIISKTEYKAKIVQDCMTEEDAFLLEMWLIAKLRHEGVSLANKTDGGEGCSNGSGSIVKVYCSNGVVYESIESAANFCRKNGFPNASCAGICASLRKTGVIYGHKWSRVSVPDVPKHTDRVKAFLSVVHIPVKCSNGMLFKSITEATEYLIGQGHQSATPAAVSRCVSGVRKIAYGYTWARA